VIEDNADGREMLSISLRLAGHEVWEAATGNEGIEMAQRHAPAIVLIDVGLPDIDGYEVGRRLRQTVGTAARLIAVTGYGQPQDRARSEQAGFDAHVVKPVELSRLAEIIQQLAR
jgi:CheY-like chemotaxis protein